MFKQFILMHIFFNMLMSQSCLYYFNIKIENFYKLIIKLKKKIKKFYFFFKIFFFKNDDNS